MNERIKKVRKSLGLTQDEFGRRLGVTRGAITNIEYNKVEPKPLFVELLCREFNVNETWLRTGEGEMFVTHTRDEAIAAFVGRVLASENDSFQKRLISVLAGLKEDEWEQLEKVALHLAEGIKKD